VFIATYTDKDISKSSSTWSSLELWGLFTKITQTNLWQTLIWITIRLTSWHTNWMNTPSDMHFIKTRYALQYNKSNNSQSLGPGATAHNPPDPH
jgi:hypothetical protein